MNLRLYKLPSPEFCYSSTECIIKEQVAIRLEETRLVAVRTVEWGASGRDRGQLGRSYKGHAWH